jgi:hypothetical protein
MFKSKRMFSYANVAATLALVFSMSGGALAAKHYLITSTKQIKPSVLKKLKGNAGKTGATGAPGATGKEGSPGKEGPQGPSNGYQAFKREIGKINESETATLGSLAVPAGSYLVSAKVWVENDSNTLRAEVQCTLTNDRTADSDESLVTVEAQESEEFTGHAMVTLEVASTLPTAGHWIVKCSPAEAAVNANQLKIQAIQVATLSNVEA